MPSDISFHLQRGRRRTPKSHRVLLWQEIVLHDCFRANNLLVWVVLVLIHFVLLQRALLNLVPKEFGDWYRSGPKVNLTSHHVIGNLQLSQTFVNWYLICSFESRALPGFGDASINYPSYYRLYFEVRTWFHLPFCFCKQSNNYVLYQDQDSYNLITHRVLYPDWWVRLSEQTTRVRAFSQHRPIGKVVKRVLALRSWAPPLFLVPPVMNEVQLEYIQTGSWYLMRRKFCGRGQVCIPYYCPQ